ncbi:MAG TPA: BON domain-containing protein [Chitinophagaceae bacterium]|nr:BON domain-containing protein [Chitinophagaceae bacterium]
MADKKNYSNPSNYEDWDQMKERYNREGNYQQQNFHGDDQNRQHRQQSSNYDQQQEYGQRYNQNYGNQQSRNYNDYPNYGGYGNQQRRDDYGANYNQQSRENSRWNQQNQGNQYGNSGSHNQHNQPNEHDWRHTGSHIGGFRGMYGYDPRSEYDQRHDYADQNRNRDQRRGGDNDRDWWEKTTDEVASWFGDKDAESRRRMDKVSGPHKGKGPRGYKRSDERIKEDINDRLYDDSFVDASEIDVKVDNGNVILSGVVDSRQVKRRAEDIAESISGVHNVENHLRVAKYDTYVGSAGIASSSTQVSHDKENDRTA